MSAAYVDTSCLVAIAFGERVATAIERSLRQHDELISSNFLEAELRSAFRRERVEFVAGATANGNLAAETRMIAEVCELSGKRVPKITKIFLAS